MPSFFAVNMTTLERNRLFTYISSAETTLTRQAEDSSDNLDVQPVCKHRKTNSSFILVNGSIPYKLKDISFGAMVSEGFQTHRRDWRSQGFWALYQIMEKRCQHRYVVMLPYTFRVGRRVKLEHFGFVLLVARGVGDDVVLRQNTTLGITREYQREDRPMIENSAKVGANAVFIWDVPTGVAVGNIPTGIINQRVYNA